MFEICLIGNPNSGKSTLFNALTGSNQKIGNWSGVTFESKEGIYKKDTSVKIVDLPGLYSFNTSSEEEKVAMRYLNENKPDVIINVVDGTNLERNLKLTCALKSINIPVVIAVNMVDELNKNDVKFNAFNLEKEFGVPVVEISAKVRIGIDDLILKAKDNEKTVRLKIDKGENDNDFIKRILKSVIVKKPLKSQTTTQFLDKVLLGKFTGLPIFFGVITLMYFLTFKIGGNLSAVINDAVSYSQFVVKEIMLNSKINILITELFCDAILCGIGTVLSFLPQILLLYVFMTIIEESGYASRIAFLLDGVVTKLGLGGKSIIPIMLSGGCTVNGLAFTKTIEDKSEKCVTIFLLPFMPCSAKTAVFAWFSAVFFGGNALIASLTYFISIFTIILSSLILKKLKIFSGEKTDFIMEIPTLRIPSLRNIISVLNGKIKEFIIKAGSVIFVVSVVMWILLNFGFCGYVNGYVEKSFIYIIGNAIKYLFYPLGFGNWQSSVAILSSLLAKEAVIEIFSIINADLSIIFSSSYVAFSFMVFVLLAPPCVASLSMAKRQLKSNKLLLMMILFQFSVAYAFSFIINIIGIILSSGYGVVLGVITVMAIVFLFVKSLRKVTKCNSCKNCKGRNCLK